MCRPVLPTPISSASWPLLIDDKVKPYSPFPYPQYSISKSKHSIFSFHSLASPWSQTTSNVCTKSNLQRGSTLYREKTRSTIKKDLPSALETAWDSTTTSLFRDRWIYDHRSGFDIETRRTLLCLSACSTSVSLCMYSPFYLIRFLDG